jgi:hypothetical protein
MAATQAANLVEKAVGHSGTATVTTDISNYNNEHGVETGEKIRATVWQGKNSVEIGMRTPRQRRHMVLCGVLTREQSRCRNPGLLTQEMSSFV